MDGPIPARSTSSTVNVSDHWTAWQILMAQLVDICKPSRVKSTAFLKGEFGSSPGTMGAKRVWTMRDEPLPRDGVGRLSTGLDVAATGGGGCSGVWPDWFLAANTTRPDQNLEAPVFNACRTCERSVASRGQAKQVQASKRTIWSRMKLSAPPAAADRVVMCVWRVLLLPGTVLSKSDGSRYSSASSAPRV